MQDQPRPVHIVRFGVFELDRRAGELRKSGVKIKLQDQPLQILTVLLEHPGEVVTREQIQILLWPAGTFVDYDHGIGTAVKKLRQALGDDADTPRYIETVHRRGFRFIAPVGGTTAELIPVPQATLAPVLSRAPSWNRWLGMVIVCTASTALIVGVILYSRRRPTPTYSPRTLTRLTFDAGLQFGPTWSPDGRFIAYSSDRGGKFDIWVQQVGSVNALKITSRPGHNWQPDWSPDGSQIVFRSEGVGGGLFVVPALGGRERRISSFGYRPQWSPDGLQILFGNTYIPWLWNKIYLVGLAGQAPRDVLSEFLQKEGIIQETVAWFPDGKRISIWGYTSDGPGFWTVSIDGRTVLKSSVADSVIAQSKEFLPPEREFRWVRSSRAIVVQARFQRLLSLWKIAVDPSTLRWTALERLTTGPGTYSGTALSPDGKRLAFTSRTERVRVWSFPFETSRGLVSAKGHAVTPLGVDAWLPDISADGMKLSYYVPRLGQWELWTKSLTDGRERLITSGSTWSVPARWAPDGRRLEHSHWKDGARCFITADDGEKEEALTSEPFDGACEDWSLDGQWVTAWRRVGEHELGGSQSMILLLPVSAAPHAETKARLVTSSRTDDIHETRLSPNGRWVVFEALKRAGRPADSATEATLYVVPASGGAWIRITDGSTWADKPRWSPDGSTIFYVSSRTGFLNVWGIRFDPDTGNTVDEPFPVTAFDSPALMVADNTDLLSMSVSKTGLIASVMEASGNIWALDDVDK